MQIGTSYWRILAFKEILSEKKREVSNATPRAFEYSYIALFITSLITISELQYLPHSLTQ